MSQLTFDFGGGPERSARDEPKRPSDHEVRHRILTSLDDVVIVEASAGTGKTQILVDRMANLVEQGRCEIGEICAITYTRKAATELRERFQNALERRLADSDGEKSARLGAAIDRIDDAFVGTIHAFCARLLRERPVEAGVAPGFRELEQGEADELNFEIWEEYIEAVSLSDEDDRLRKLESLGVSADRLRYFYKWYCGELDIDLVRSETNPPAMRLWWERVRRRLSDLSPRLAGQPSSWSGWWESIRGAERLLQRLDEPADLDVVELLEMLETGQPQGKDLRDGLKPADVKDDWEELKRTARDGLREWREHVHGFVVDLVAPAARTAQERRRIRGELMFSDLLILARDMLRDYPEIRRFFQRRYTRFFIDEFQDTDPVQTEIIFFLAGDRPESKSWREQTPRPGSLFIVGDPKQSIYRFRRADIALYKEVFALIEAAGGRSERLTTNFRSTPTVCAWVNDRFERILISEEGDVKQASYTAVDAFRDDAGGEIRRRDWTHAEIRNNEPGKTLAAALKQIVESGEPAFGLDRAVRWSDFLVLAWERRRLAEIAMAFEDQRVPYEVTGAKKVGFEELLVDLIPLLRAIIDQDDEVALLGFLRGPYCGASDQDLYEFRRAGGRWRVGSDLPAETPGTIRSGFELVEESRENVRTLPPAAALGRLVDRIGLAPMNLAGPQGRVRAGSVFLLTAIARDRSARTGARFEEIVDLFEQLARNSGDREPLVLDAGNDDRVRLMNLHQAKGLEGNIVILTDPEKPKTRDPVLHVDRDAEHERPQAYATVTRLAGDYATREVARPVGWDAHREEEEEFEEGQRDRLLYVAATRARDAMLIDFYRNSKNEQVSPWGRLEGEDLPTFDPPPIDDDLAEPDLGDDPVKRWRELEEERRQALARVSAPSWREQTVTTLEHRPLDPADRPRAGRGDAWGRAMHSVLESLMISPELDVGRLVENSLTFEGLDESLLEEGIATVRAVLRSELWKRALRADQKMAEVPIFFLAEEGRERVRGVIDLVFREEGGWVLVDYKSDVVENRLEALVDAYSGQVRRYVAEWSRLTGDPVQGVLFFIDGNREVPVV